MSNIHGANSRLSERVHKFVVAGATGELTDDLWTDFEQLLRESDDACRLYLECTDVSVLLPSILSAIPDEESPGDLRFLQQQPTTLPPAPVAFSSVWQGMVGGFSSGWPVAYLAAMVIFGIGLVVGALVHVSEPVRMPMWSAAVRTGPSLPESRKEDAVGRITGLVDCQWAAPATKTANGAHVPLGRKYALRSGLLEITYDTGARVILQGPVTYEVESPSGGYLSVGRLTAKLEKRGESDANHRIPSPKSQIAAPSPLSSHLPPLFVVRTPTATVTDMGTEFGVEVQPDHRQQVVVFRGRVRVVSASDQTAPQNRTVLLSQGQSIRVEPGKELLPRPDSDAVASRAFVRQIPASLPKTPVVRNASFEDRGFNDEGPPKYWHYWAATGDGRALPVLSDIGGLAATSTGDHVLQIICYSGSAVQAWQSTGARFVAGQRYSLTVTVGMRNDLRNKDCAAEADWKISLNYADADKEVAGLGGTIANDAAHTGFMRDQTLTYTATPADAQHGIEIRLLGSTVGKRPCQADGASMICMNFDNVRLNVATAPAPEAPGPSKKDAARRPSGPPSLSPRDKGGESTAGKQ